nr:Chain C, LEU-ASN-PRO-SER-VAL-ALA-ALA-THR-LEU [Hepacivirus hominis]
LNPSVAATL